MNFLLWAGLWSPVLLLVAPEFVGTVLGKIVHDWGPWLPQLLYGALYSAGQAAWAEVAGQRTGQPEIMHLVYNATEAALQAAGVGDMGAHGTSASANMGQRPSPAAVPIMIHPPAPPNTLSTMLACMMATLSSTIIASKWGGRAAAAGI